MSTSPDSWKRIDLPYMADLEPDTYFIIIYYQNPPPRTLGKPFRPYDPVVMCETVLPDASFEFPPRVGSVSLTAAKLSQGEMPNCRNYKNAPGVAEQLLGEAFKVKVTLDDAPIDPRVIITGYNR